jgi:hypothetical protein
MMSDLKPDMELDQMRYYNNYKSYNGGLMYSYLNREFGCNICGEYSEFPNIPNTIACITCGAYCQTCADVQNIIIDDCSLLCQMCDFEMTEDVSTIIMVSIPSFPSVITDIISKYDDSESRSTILFNLLESRVPTRFDCGHIANISLGTLEEGLYIECILCQKMQYYKNMLLEEQFSLKSLYVINAIQDFGVSDIISILIAKYM